MSVTQVVNVRGWPGLDDWKERKPTVGYRDRFGERNALVVHAASDAGVEGDTFGLCIVLFVAGRSIVRGAVLVADDLESRDRTAFTDVHRFADGRPVCAKPGAPTWEVLTLGQFFDPQATVKCGHLAYAPNAYTGQAFTVGWDLGRFFGLVAEHVAPRRGKWAGSWDVWLPGWGKIGPAGNWHRSTPHRPVVRLKNRRTGSSVSWGPCEKGNGKKYPGDFIDLASLAYALDGDRGATYAEHRENAGLAPTDLAFSVSVDGSGTAKLVEAVEDLYELSLVLDEKAAQWFTTSRERDEGRGKIPLAWTVSVGAIAAQIPAQFRVEAPLSKFDLSPGEHAAWMESFHGGICDAHPGAIGLVLPAASVDLTSAFPLTANLIDWWDVRTAARLSREDVRQALCELCARAVEDPGVVLDPAVWHRFGLTLATVIPDGEFWPIEIEDRRRPDGRLEVVPVSSPSRPMFFAWPAVVAAAILSGQVPTIQKAERLVPEGRQEGLRSRLPILPGLVLDVEDDPGVALVCHRQAAKVLHDSNLAAELRGVVNSLCFGNMARFDERRRKVGRKWTVGEVPGPETFLPIASTVTSGAYLLLAVLQRLASDLDSVVLYRDTDSSIFPTCPEGGTVKLGDGLTVHALSWDELDTIVDKFDPLAVFGKDIPVLKIERGTRKHPLHTLVAGPKRHVEFTLDDAGSFKIVHRTDTQLGGTYADPPTVPGRAPDGHREFSLGALKSEIALARARERDAETACRTARAAWDVAQPLPFPAVRRLSVSSPGMLATLPSALGAHAGSRFLEPVAADVSQYNVLGYSGRGVVAIDPGDDLSGWHSLRWYDRRTGNRLRVTTDMTDPSAVRLVSLAGKAADWGWPPAFEPIAEVTVNPFLICHVGRVSGVIDAGDEGLPGSLAALRPTYSAADLQGALRDYLTAWGSLRFAAKTGIPRRTVREFARGRSLSKKNAHLALSSIKIDDGTNRICALDDCDHSIMVPRAKYCQCKTHGDHRRRAQKRRQRAEDELAASSDSPPGNEELAS